MRSLLAAASLALATSAAHAVVLDDHVASDEDRVAVVMDMVDAWNTHDWDRVANLFAEDGVLHSMMVDPVVGRDVIGARIAHLGEGISEITLNVRHIGVIDDVVFIERTDDFTYNGHEGSVPVVGVIEIGEDGLITEWREYYDRDQLLGAMGLNEDFDDSAQ
ncbi:SgcJ/EcaC family oxidoreductase [Oceanicaulis sp. LC35]|uniref:SgcJ/EcaC family oxidoreductase n=1 Tax=Oceanicaulis sp. LC35 TaxID=3349635 RepID=UPI003F879C16